MYFPC